MFRSRTLPDPQDLSDASQADIGVARTVMRRSSRVAILVGVLQGLVIAVGWYAMYQTTHEQVAEGVEDIIVQNNEQMARSIIEAIGGLEQEVEFGSQTWERLQDIVERVELTNGGFACIVDAAGHIICHPEMRKNPGLRDIDLSSHALVDGSGGQVALQQVSRNGIVSGSMDFLFDGKHYVATQALGEDGTRLIVHQPVSGLTAASRHLTSGLILQAVVLGVLVVGMTILIVFFILRLHDGEVLRWNAELDEKVRRRTSELRAALDSARRAAAVKDEFLANMSHELRTPMNGVLGTIEMLADTELDAEQEDMVRTIRESGAGLLELLSDVIEYSSAASASPQAARRERFGLDDLLYGCRRHVLAGAEAKVLPVGVHVGEGVPDALLGDPERLGRILRNLLENAVNFTELGRIDVRVTRVDGSGTAEPGDELALRFEVEDTGIGIAPEQHDHVFDHFTQVDGSTTRRVGGMGLGLAVARAHAAIMGGELQLVSSEPGVGSVFALTVDVLVPVQDPAVEAAPAVAASTSSTTSASGDTTVVERAAPETSSSDGAPVRAEEDVGGTRVLVVEDNKVNQRVAARILERLGCEVVVADNGRLGVEALGEREFDVVFMDCQMPVMGGLDATEAIRTLPEPACDVPIVALTAHALPEEMERAYAAGMDDYMTKPVDLPRLRGAVQRWRHGRGLTPA